MAIEYDAVDPTGGIEGYSEAKQYQPSQEENKLVGKFNDRLHKCKSHRYKYAQDWEFNRFYIDGEQLLFRDSNTHEVVHVNPQNLKRLYSINNQMKPAGRSLHGKLCRAQPHYNVSPPPIVTGKLLK